MAPFYFKQFSVDDEGCPMKVGTDSVLLGAWTDFRCAHSILDVGCGCGLLALMAAQRSKADITAIDIDKVAIEKASDNFSGSLWLSRLFPIRSNFIDFFSENRPVLFDHIITNPPYFINSLKAPTESRNRARHNDTLPFSELVKGTIKLLNSDGFLSLVLPMSESVIFEEIARNQGLFLDRELLIRPFPHSKPNRRLMEFGQISGYSIHSRELTIRENKDHYSEEYKLLTKDFYLGF